MLKLKDQKPPKTRKVATTKSPKLRIFKNQSPYVPERSIPYPELLVGSSVVSELSGFRV